MYQETPEITETPETTGTPQSPEATEAPQAPEATETPEATKTLEDIKNILEEDPNNLKNFKEGVEKKIGELMKMKEKRGNTNNEGENSNNEGSNNDKVNKAWEILNNYGNTESSQ